MTPSRWWSRSIRLDEPSALETEVRFVSGGNSELVALVNGRHDRESVPVGDVLMDDTPFAAPRVAAHVSRLR